MFMNYFLLIYIVSTRRKNTMEILVKHLSRETTYLFKSAIHTLLRATFD